MSMFMPARVCCHLRGVGHLEIGVANASEIPNARVDVEILEQTIAAFLGLEFGDGTLGVLDIAKDDRLGRTDLRTSTGEAVSRNLDIARTLNLRLGGDFRLLDALNTE